MKNVLMLVCALAVLSGNALAATTAFVPAVTVVNGQLDGVMIKLTVSIHPSTSPGNGKAFATVTPLSGFFLQDSAQTAKDYAKTFTGKDLENYDVLFRFDSDAILIDGPSAGAIMTTALAFEALGKAFPQNVSMTGTIENDGSVGPIGGVYFKARGAAKQGIKLFLVPQGQSMTLDENFDDVNLVTYAPANWGMNVAEVSSIQGVVQKIEQAQLPAQSVAIDEFRVLSEFVQSGIVQKVKLKARANPNIKFYAIDWNGDGNYDQNVNTDTAVLDENIDHDFQESGSVTIKVLVKNSLDTTAVATHTLTVNSSSNKPPVITTPSDVVKAFKGVSVELRGTATDSDGVIARYQWDFDGDGNYDYNSNSTGVASFTYNSSKAYYATFKATDNAGATAELTIIVNVTDKPVDVNTSTVAASANSTPNIVVRTNPAPLGGYRNAGESCIASTQCSTGYCYNSKCAFAPSSTPAASPPSPAPTTPPTPAQEKKTERKGVGEVCTSSVDCLSGKCVNNACVECVEDTDCTQAQQCGLSYECENVSCANGVVENHYCIPRAGTASTQQQPPQKPPQAQATKQQSQPASGTASSPVTSTAQGAPQGNPLTAFASLAPKVTASSVVPPVAYAVIAGLIAWLVFHYLQGRKFPQDAALESAAGAGAVSFLVPWGMSQLMNWTIALVWPGIVAVFLVLLLLTESSAKAGAAALNTQQQV